MQIFTVVFLACWLLLAGSADAHAGPLVGLVAAVGSLFSSLGVIGQLVLGMVVKLGVGLLQKALAKKQDRQEPGVKGQISIGGDEPQSFIMGNFGTPGHLEYAGTWGSAGDTPNAYLVHVISLADLPMKLTGLWVNDKKVTLPDMTAPMPSPHGWNIPEYMHGGAARLYVQYFDGTQTEPSPYLINAFGSDPSLPWMSDQIGHGVPYAILVARVTPELYSGFPQYFFETSGVNLYDISKDTSAGGFGAHRWGDPATWQPSNNPIVQSYNLIRGVYFNGEWVYGGQTTKAYQLPASNWIAGINAANQATALSGGGTQPRYRSGCEINVDQEPLGVIENLLKGASARLAEIGGSYKVLAGVPGAPVYSFTDETIIITEGQSFDPFPGLEQTFNGAQASYPEPGEKWQPKDAPAYYRADLEILDDNRRLATGLAFATVPYPVQVQMLLKEAVDDARRFRVHQFCLPPEAWVLEPNDIVAWTSARNSYTNKKFIIVDIVDQPDTLQLVTIREIDPADFAWNPLTDQRPVSISPLVGPRYPAPQPMVGWQAFPAAQTDSAGTDRRPSIGIRYNGKLDDIEFVQVQVRRIGASVIFDGMEPYGDPVSNGNPVSTVLNGVFLPNTNYEARGKFVPFGDRLTEWSEWLPVKTDDIRLGADDFWPIPLTQLPEDAKNMLAWVGNSVRDIRDELEDVTSYIGDVNFGSVTVAQSLRREITASYESNRASWTEAIDVAVGPTSALAQRVETIDVSLSSYAKLTVTDALAGRVAATEGQFTSVGTRLTSIENAIPGKVDNTTFTSWQNTVTQHGNDITAINTVQNGLQSALNGYSSANAVANALTATNTNVSNIGGVVSAQSSRVDSLFAAMGGNSTEILVRNAVMAGPAGYARIAAIAKATTGGDERSAGYVVDLPTNTSLPARFSVYAQQFVVMDRTNEATIANPFLVDGNGVYINNLFVRNLTADNISATKLNADQVLQGGSLLTEVMGFNAVTAHDEKSVNQTYTGTFWDNSWRDVAVVTCNNQNPNPVFLNFVMSFQSQDNVLTGVDAGRLRLVRQDSRGVSVLHSVQVPENGFSVSSGNIFMIDPDVRQETYTYRVQTGGIRKTTNSSAVVTTNLYALWWKR